MFSESSTGSYLGLTAAAQANKENILQNLLLNLPPQTVELYKK